MDKSLVCIFCDKHFKYENNYLKHKCKQMERHAVLGTNEGLLAYLLFNQWRTISNYPPVEVDTFAKSRYFNSMVSFVNFIKTKGVPDRIGYIEWLVSKNLLPHAWTDYDVYDAYLAYFDGLSVDSKIEASLKTIHELCDKHECKPSDLFNILTPLQFIRLITKRKLSPWLMLLSSQFLEFVMYRVTKSDRVLFKQYLDPKIWSVYFTENPEEVTKIKKITRDLGI